jgi:anti-sigma-K factor RskA
MNGAGLPHASIEELIAADALDGLDELDRSRLDQELERHGPDCPECRRLLTEYGLVAAMLAATTDPVPLSPGAEDRLMEAIRRQEQIQPEEELPAPAAALRRRGRTARWVTAAAVAAVIAVVAGAVGYELAHGRSSSQAQLAAFLAQPGTRVVPFPSKDGQQLAVAVHAGEPSAWIVGKGLPDLPGGKVYELWYSPVGDEGVRPAGTFSPDDGSVVAQTTVGADFDILAVSVEPAGGSKQPTTQPIFVTTTQSNI